MRKPYDQQIKKLELRPAPPLAWLISPPGNGAQFENFRGFFMIGCDQKINPARCLSGEMFAQDRRFVQFPLSNNCYPKVSKSFHRLCT